MKMQTNLSGRLRNTSLPITSGLLPLFEAVVNGIQFNHRIVMTTIHTAMNTVLKANNSVRHLPLAQLEGRAAPRGVAQQLRNGCANVRRNYWCRKKSN